jgi:hypothetical protein
MMTRPSVNRSFTVSYASTGIPTVNTIRSAFLILVVLFLVSVPSSVFAQESIPLQITEVRYEMDGRTRQWAIEDILEIDEGMTFESEEVLVAYLAGQQQLLTNQRILQEASVTFERTSTLLEDDDDNTDRIQNVVVTVTTKDTWNFIVLPYFKYDSNTGLLLSLRTRDYNFFGTNQALSIDFDYERTDEEEDLFTIAADFRLPFNMFDRRWELIVEESLELEASDIDFELSTGLGYYFDFLGLEWEAIYTESYRYMTDDPDDDYFFTSRFDLGATIDTGIPLPGFGPLAYRPNVYTEWNYTPDGISEERKGPSVGFEHYLEAGDFDWIGNYRNGQTFSVGNDNEYNIRKEEWDRSITFETALYRSLWQPQPEDNPKAGVSTAVSGFYLIDGASEDQDDAAKAARGVLNDAMNGDLGVFLNLDTIITFWTLEPIFEAQFGAFFDIAYVRDLRGDFYEKTAFDSDRDLRYGAGIEIVGFPLFARSLYVRGSLGFDLVAINEALRR